MAKGTKQRMRQDLEVFIYSFDTDLLSIKYAQVTILQYWRKEFEKHVYIIYMIFLFLRKLALR